MSVLEVTDHRLSALLAAWLPGQRWFSGKAGVLGAVSIGRRSVLHSAPDLRVEFVLVDVEVDGATQIYQVPLAFAHELPDERRVHPLTGDGTDQYDGPAVYDALRDPRVTAIMLEYIAGIDTVGGLRFHRVDGTEIPVGSRGRLLGVEQSNSSLVYGDDLLLKVFRRVRTGLNPDVEVHAALSERGSPAVAALRGWIETEVHGEPTTLAMAQDFLVGAADGWSMSTGSVRDLFAEADLLAEEVGTDFADESRRLGATVAQVHDDLARALGTGTRRGADLGVTMRARLDTATATVPQLAPFADAARAVFDEVAELGDVEVQRVHGDLHLGQLLRAPDRWIVLDFEGEPAAPLAERRAQDCPLRDVAGMLRSFDYAAHHTLVGVEDRQRVFRAREWRERNVEAFCAGYAEVSDADPRDSGALLRAYALDKAVYEAVYEAGNRPGWLPIPLGAVERLLTPPET